VGQVKGIGNQGIARHLSGLLPLLEPDYTKKEKILKSQKYRKKSHRAWGKAHSVIAH
jgi:hypothetical protein